MKILKKSLLGLSGLLLSTSLYAQVIENGTYFIVSEYSGDCVELDSADENIKAVQAVCKDKEAQKFAFTNVGDDNYTISSLGVGENSQSNGAHVYNTATAEEFKVESVDNRYYKIKSNTSGKYLTSKPYSNEVIQYKKHNSDDQLWFIIDDYNLIDALPCDSSASCYALNSSYALHPDKGLIIFVDGYWQSTDGLFLAKNYNLNGNTWFDDTNYAENAYYFEHEQYTNSEHRRVDNNQIWASVREEINEGVHLGSFPGSVGQPQAHYYCRSGNAKSNLGNVIDFTGGTINAVNYEADAPTSFTTTTACVNFVEQWQD